MIVLATIGLCVAAVSFFSRKQRLFDFYSKNNLIDTGTLINHYLLNYLQEHLPLSVRPLFATHANNFQGVRIYIIISNKTSLKKLQPFNATYDLKEDCIYIDRRLISMAMVTRSGGVNAFLGFILLHELGHRTLHRNGKSSFDVTDQNKDPVNQSQKKENEADHWAAEKYLELLPLDSAGIFINEPDSLPLLNLMEGGFLTSVSQYGPYSPIIQGEKHPSVYTRLLNFFIGLAGSKKLRPSDALFYATEALRLQNFLIHIDQYLRNVIMLDEGDLPLSAAIQDGYLWIRSYKDVLYKVALNQDRDNNVEHIKATKVETSFPTNTKDFELLSTNGVLILINHYEKPIYYFDQIAAEWKFLMECVGEENYADQNDLYTWKYDLATKLMRIFKVDPITKMNIFKDSINCSAFIGMDNFKVKFSSEKILLFIQDDVAGLSVYQLRPGIPRLMKKFENINEFSIDPNLRYLEVKYDRELLKDSVHPDAHYDKFGRIYRVDNYSHSLYLKAVSPFGGAIDIFDLQTGKYLICDQLLESAPNTMNKVSKEEKYYILHSEFFTAICPEIGIFMTDDILRNCNVVLQSNWFGQPVVIADVPYSRYLLVFDYYKKTRKRTTEPIEIHSIDL